MRVCVDLPDELVQRARNLGVDLEAVFVRALEEAVINAEKEAVTIIMDRVRALLDFGEEDVTTKLIVEDRRAGE